MKRCALVIALVLLAGSAWCGDGIYGNNLEQPNQYQTHSSQGRTITQGYSPSTGQSWDSQTVGSHQSGTNAQGQFWSYDGNTGVYQNYGTGEVRINQPQHRQKAW